MPDKICYIILTCEAYLDTRTKWQRTNCFKYTDLKDVYYLSCKPGPLSVYGWNTIDTYESCPLKYIEFFKNMDLEYDWYVFLDDDAFVFPDRMTKRLLNFDKTESLFIGMRYQYGKVVYMLGGGGFVLSNTSYNLIKNYVRDTVNSGSQPLKSTIWGDVTIGEWIAEINKNSSILFKHDVNFSIYPHKTEEELQINETFHYLKQEAQFDFYGSLVKQ
jgi:hypothetical protein